MPTCPAPDTDHQVAHGAARGRSGGTTTAQISRPTGSSRRTSISTATSTAEAASAPRHGIVAAVITVITAPATPSKPLPTCDVTITAKPYSPRPTARSTATPERRRWLSVRTTSPCRQSRAAAAGDAAGRRRRRRTRSKCTTTGRGRSQGEIRIGIPRYGRSSNSRRSSRAMRIRDFWPLLRW